MFAALNFIHLLSMVIWVGMIVFFTFFAAPSVFKALPRELAGEVIGHIFPKYWAVGYLMSAVSIGTVLYLSSFAKVFPTLRVSILVVMAVLSLYSGLVVGREARSIKAEIKAVESVEEKETLRSTFKKVHAKSAILNLLILILGIFYIFLISRDLTL